MIRIYVYIIVMFLFSGCVHPDPESTYYVHSAAVDSEGNLYVLAEGDAIVPKFLHSSQFDWWIKKYSPELKENRFGWNKKIDFGSNVDIPENIKISKKDEIFCVGEAGTLTAADWWIKKFYSDGREDKSNWNKISDLSGGYDRAYDMDFDENGNIYVCGNGMVNVNDKYNFKSRIKKYDKDGKEDIVNWDKKFDNPLAGKNSESSNNADTIIVSPSGDIIVAGHIDNIKEGVSQSDLFLKKYNSNGIEDIVRWNRIYDYGEFDVPVRLFFDHEGNLIIVGSKWVKKYNSECNALASGFDIQFPDFSIITDAVMDSEKNIFISYKTTNESEIGFFIRKYNSDGYILTVNSKDYIYSGNHDIFINALAIDKNDNIFAVSNNFILKIDKNGNTVNKAKLL